MLFLSWANIPMEKIEWLSVQYNFLSHLTESDIKKLITENCILCCGCRCDNLSHTH